MEAPLQPVSGDLVAILDGLAPVQQPSSEDPVDAYLARLTSSASRRVQASALETIARRIAGDTERSAADRGLRYQVPWHQLTAAHTGRIRALLLAPDPATGRPLAPATLNRTLVALRRVLKECWRLGLMDRESYERAADLDSLPGTRLPTGRDLSMGELRALFEVCAADPSPVGRRDAALFALLREGLRRAEAAALQLEQLDLEQAEVRVIGKRDQERLVPLQPGAIAAIRDWLACREAQLGSATSGPVLLRLRKPRRDETAQILPHSLTAVTVNQRVERRSREAAVARLTPHDWRRTYVGDVLDLCGDLSIAQQLAGHASPATTSRYDRRPAAARRRAAGGLHVPYVAPGTSAAPTRSSDRPSATSSSLSGSGDWEP